MPDFSKQKISRRRRRVSATDTLRLYFFVKEGNSYENN